MKMNRVTNRHPGMSLAGITVVDGNVAVVFRDSGLKHSGMTNLL
jgi:hypothetical protein